MLLQRVIDPADPRRCKGATPAGQCMNEAEDGCENCLIHNGQVSAISPTKRIYLLTRAAARNRLAELAEHDEVKSLREEIALTRMMIETQFNGINSDLDWAMRWPAIERGIRTVHGLVKDCHVIEQNLGSMLSKTTVLSLANRICQVVIDRLQGIDNYTDLTDDIIHSVIQIVQDANNEGVVRSVALLPSSPSV
jgi:hypothetical protein